MEPLIYYRQQKFMMMQTIFLAVAIGVGIWLVAFFRPHNYIAQYCFIGLGVLLLVLSVFGVNTLIKGFTGPKEILIVDETGIIDRTTNHGVPLIKWEDVKGIREEVVTIHKFVRIDIAKTDEYIKQGRNAMKRRMLKNNMKMYGSPFVISARLVGQKHDNLLELIRFTYLEQKEKNTPKKAVEPTAPASDEHL